MAFIETKQPSALKAALSTSKQATKGVFSIFQSLKSTMAETQRRKKLRNMSPHLLRDIGLTPGDISVLQAEQKHFDSMELETLRHIR
jgi:uncharacterized protein YjiS (DUF1127 family)